MSLKAGISGVGSFYSDAFANAALKHSDIDLVAFAHLNQTDEELRKQSRRTSSEFGEHYKLKPYSQTDEMVQAEALDLVFVTAHDNLKDGEAVAAATAGAHVYISKPMCMTLEGAEAIIEAGKRTNVLVSTLMPGRDDGAIRAMANRVRAGEVGKVLSARAWIQHGCFGPDTIFEGSVEFGPGQGGIDLSLGFYAADLLLWLIDSNPIRAFAEYDNLGTPHSLWMDTGKGTVRFADGRMGSMDIIFNVNCGAPAWEMEVVGADGIARAHLDMMEGILWHKEDPGTPRVFYRHQNDVIGEGVGRFVRSIVEGTPLDITPEHGRNVLELCLAWTRSANEHQAISLPL